MNKTFEHKFDQRGALFSSSCSLSKPDSVRQLKQTLKFEFSNAYLGSTFTKVICRDEAMAAKEFLAEIGDGLGEVCDTSENTSINDGTEVEQLTSSSDESSNMEYGAAIIMPVRKNVSKDLVQEILFILSGFSSQCKRMKKKLFSYFSIYMRKHLRQKRTRQCRWSIRTLCL